MKLHPSTTRLRMAGATLAAVLLLSACGSSSTPAASSSTGNSLGLLSPGKIEAAAGTDQPPFAFADANGKPEGFIIDITNEVAKRLGLTVEYKSTTVPAALAGLTSGQYDLAASGLGVTSERLKSVAFSKGLFWSTTAVLTTKTTSASGLTDLQAKRWAWSPVRSRKASSPARCQAPCQPSSKVGRAVSANWCPGRLTHSFWVDQTPRSTCSSTAVSRSPFQRR